MTPQTVMSLVGITPNMGKWHRLLKILRHVMTEFDKIKAKFQALMES
jgi:hypothetical protein